MTKFYLILESGERKGCKTCSKDFIPKRKRCSISGLRETRNGLIKLHKVVKNKTFIKSGCRYLFGKLISNNIMPVISLISFSTGLVQRHGKCKRQCIIKTDTIQLQAYLLYRYVILVFECKSFGILERHDNSSEQNLCHNFIARCFL